MCEPTVTVCPDKSPSAPSFAIQTRRPGSLNGRGRISSASTTLKTVALAPIPSPTTRIAKVVKPASRRSVRNEYRRSCSKVSKNGTPRTARCSSLICVNPPNSNRAARWACCGLMPARIWSSVSMARCEFNSSSRSESSSEARNQARKRATIRLSRASMELPPRTELQQSSNHARDSLPILRFGDKLFAAGFRDGIELGFPVVLRCAPLSSNPALLNKPDQAEINGPLIHEQRFLADLLDPAGDAIAVQRPHRVQGLQNHQIQGALKNIGLAFGHLISCGLYI